MDAQKERGECKSEWPELEKAIHAREEENKKAWRKLEADLYADELNDKLPLILQARRVRESLAGHEAQVLDLIQQWHVPVKDALRQMAQAQSGRFKDRFKELIIEIPEHASHGLYWQAYAPAFPCPSYYSIRLLTDETYHPVHFLIECRAQGNFLTAEARMDDLKEKLVQAFKCGPFGTRDHAEPPGMEVARFLQKHAHE